MRLALSRVGDDTIALRTHSPSYTSGASITVKSTNPDFIMFIYARALVRLLLSFHLMRAPLGCLRVFLYTLAALLRTQVCKNNVVGTSQEKETLSD